MTSLPVSHLYYAMNGSQSVRPWILDTLLVVGKFSNEKKMFTIYFLLNCLRPFGFQFLIFFNWFLSFYYLFFIKLLLPVWASVSLLVTPLLPLLVETFLYPYT